MGANAMYGVAVAAVASVGAASTVTSTTISMTISTIIIIAKITGTITVATRSRGSDSSVC